MKSASFDGLVLNIEGYWEASTNGLGLAAGARIAYNRRSDAEVGTALRRLVRDDDLAADGQHYA